MGNFFIILLYWFYTSDINMLNIDLLNNIEIYETDSELTKQWKIILYYLIDNKYRKIV
jgi:hypothetical protein